jgi:hypothetical protein
VVERVRDGESRLGGRDREYGRFHTCPSPSGKREVTVSEPPWHSAILCMEPEIFPEFRWCALGGAVRVGMLREVLIGDVRAKVAVCERSDNSPVGV